MPARRLPVAALFLGVCAAACGQEPASVVAPDPRLASDRPGEVKPPPVTELPPFLAVPPAPVVATPPRRPCHACPNEYHPCHVYLPDQNPDWGAGSCDGECGPCRLSWCSADFLCLKTKSLDEVERKTALGARFGAGHWFGPDRALGVEASLFTFHDPFQRIEAGPTLVNSPITMTGFELNGRAELWAIERWRVEGLAGYRYVQLHEALFVGNAAFVVDQSARNELHAAQIGAIGTYRFGAYFHEVWFKLGAGENSATIKTNGVRMSDSAPALVGDFGVRCGYQIGEGCWFTVGLDVLYLSSVDRPSRGQTDFWIHGLTAGFEKRF